jgi:hypothetical protein
VIHLRQGWIDADGHGDRELLLVRSAAPLGAILTNVARLAGPPADGDTRLAGAKLAGVSESLVARVLALEGEPHHAHQVVSDLPAYLDACQHLWAFIDSWQPR